MPRHCLSLVVLAGTYAVCRLSPDAGFPAWAEGEFVSLTRTPHELSVICPEGVVPEGVRCEGGWRVLRVAGVLDFSLVGVLASLVEPLAEAGLSVFVVSTFDTDYLLVKETDLPKATRRLSEAGHAVDERP